ncbi:mevalonate kinase [Companilactobacillus insicii]|uniref:mevalonate kinase n=1 Tax=Companilactobacillus insicii TaxID=1732567 RepID=UPI000F767C8A|nr:mevalonate kinase [Companilactobacillus insicii]
MLKGIGKSHGKTIIMGEHAVVYGYPAIAIPLVSIPVIVRINEIDNKKESTLSSKYYVGKINDLPESLSGVKFLINLLDEKLNKNSVKYSISIESSLPIERGLGSSAAIGTAITRAFFNFFDDTLTHDILVDYVNKSETVTHGKASGLDALTVISNAPVQFSRKDPVNYFTFKTDGFLVIADSGVKGKTKETVSDVKKMYDNDPQTIGEILKQLGQCTKKTSLTLNNNRLKDLGQTFNEANSLLSELNLSIPKTDKLIKSANNAGALGSKITGGGRGGCIISLARNLTSAEMIQKALIKSGAEQTWLQPLSIYAEESDGD